MSDDYVNYIDPIKTVIESSPILLKGWSWLKRKRFGTVAITKPYNRESVAPGWVKVEGTHTYPKNGSFWLFTIGHKEYWPQERLSLLPDGRWVGRANVADMPGPRISAIYIVWVTDFVDSLLVDISTRNNHATRHKPIRMTPDPKQFSIVQGVVVSVQ